MRLQLGLANEDNLQQFLPLLEVGEDPDFFEQRQRQVLCLVDDDDGEGLQRDERIEELVERVAEIGARGAGQAAALQVGERHDAEVHEQHLQQVFARHERIGHECRERPSIEMLQHRSNQRRLASTDLAGQDDEPFAAADTRQEFFEGRGVRGTAIEEARIRREAERFFLEAVVGLVGQGRRGP